MSPILAAAAGATTAATAATATQWWFPHIYFLGYRAGQFASSALQHGLPDPSDVGRFLLNFPVLYREWWWNLVANDPIHVMVETTLMASIAVILLRTRRSADDWKKQHKLSPEEENELLADWKKSRAPLTPSTVEDYVEDSVVVQKCGKIMTLKRYAAMMDVPHSSSGSGSGSRSGRGAEKAAEGAAAIDGSGTVDDANEASNDNTEKKEGGAANDAVVVVVDNEDDDEDDDDDGAELLTDVLNMATLDFLGMGSSEAIKAAANEALDRYGCGSCGPRGFYGTVDVHLKLEEQFARFWGTEGAILYSDGASTVSSTIAAFCKRGDLLVVDDGVSEPLVTGVTLSRAHVKWFAHNDMSDLRRIMEQVKAKDEQLGRPMNAQRRFVIVEGLYRNSGTICPLDELVRLKDEFAYRLILDESCAAGVLGPTGRGVTELYQMRPMHQVDITTIGLEAAIGSVGGVTVGSEEVVEHQRLSGSGYCFSASAPPFTAVAAMTSLQMLHDNPDDYLQRIGDNVVYMYEKLKAWCEERGGLLEVTSDERSPIVVLQVASVPETESLDEGVFFGEVSRECLDRGVAVCVGGRGQQSASPSSSSRPAPVPPTLRMALTADHLHADIDRALSVLAEAVDEVMGQFLEEAKQS